VAVLLVTHNLGVVAELADRVVVLHHGRIVERRAVSELFARPATDYTRDLLASVPRLAEGGVPAPRREDTGEAVLELAEVSVVYPGKRGRPALRAVHGVSLAVRPGEVVGLVGESGSGKTTVGRAAVGLVPVSAGRVRLGGRDLAALSRAELRAARRGLAMVHQDPAAALDPRFTVGESIAEPLLIHGAAVGTRVADLLTAVRLPAAYADRRPGELSGGQRQRVALARALALAPRLVIADEPTSALDVSVQADVLDLFDELRRELGFGCLFISHDLGVVDRVADRVAVLRDGELLELGSPGEVFTAPRHDYTRALLEAVPRVPVRV
jgi:peptide/nickel transport system ATP-binding protein